MKCSECGRDISDKAPTCLGCGAPNAAIGLGTTEPPIALPAKDMPGVDYVTAVLSSIKDKVTTTAEAAAEKGKELLMSPQEKDADAVKQMAEGFGAPTRELLTDSEVKCGRFKAALESTIDVKFAEIMRGKGDAERFLTYVDGQILTASVRNVFKSALGATPRQVEAACTLSEAVLAPTSEERQRLVKTAAGVGGGAAGLAMIIAGIGGALGWGAGVVASVTTFFAGASLAGPIGWIVAGVTLVGVAAYFATTNNKHTDTERFISVLKASTGRSVDAIWNDHEQALVKALSGESTA